LHAFDIEPLTADFPFARTLIVLRSERTIKKTGSTEDNSRYYLSSAPPAQYQPLGWLKLIRGHWAGVEVRNHWRRDASMGEDGSRSHNPTLLANVALIRNALLQIVATDIQEQSLPESQEHFQRHPGLTLTLIARS